jgi:signal transduction histidine kinase/ActR/RegA family two-component response regulator
MNLPRRSRRLLAVGAAIACFVIASTLTAHKILHDEKRVLETFRTGIWAAVQGQVEYLKFAMTLDDYVRGGGTVSHDSLMERYDILWSRFPVILEGGESEAMRHVLPGLTDGVGTAFIRLQALEPAITALRPGDTAALTRLQPEIAAIGEPFQDLVFNAVNKVGEIGHYRETQRNQTELVAYAGASILSGLVLILLLIQQNAEARRLYRSARNAENHAAAIRLDYLQAIESIDEGFCLYDEADRLILCNEKFRELYAPIREHIVPGVHFEALIRAAVAGNFYPLTPEQHAHWLDRRMERHRTPGAAFAHETRDGRTIRVKEYRTRVGGTVTITTDATAERKAERERTALTEQLHQARKMEAVGALAGGIAHDFNNILTSILGNAALAQMDLPASSPLQEMIQEILTAGERARNLVRQILAFSRHQDQAKGPVRLDVVINEAVQMLRATLPSTITLATEIEPPEPSVMGDATQLHQVIMNLCVNASHAIGAKPGTIRLRVDASEADAAAAAAAAGPKKTRTGSPPVKIERIGNDRTRMSLGEIEDGPQLRLTITDTGCGMNYATLTRIFDPFFTTKPVGKGTGLGLAAVQGIVLGLGGSVVVESTLDAGTSFTIVLPKANVEAVTDLPVESPSASLQPGKGAILFIDDEPSVARMGSRTLERAGYTVESMIDSEEALRAFRESPDRWDLVITDLTMPRLTGLAMAKTMLAIRPNLPIVLCTGFSESINETEAKASGITEFLMKPVVGAELTTLVDRALHHRSPLAGA